MKKINCFSVAAFISIVMFISASLTLKFKYELWGTVDQVQMGIIILQCLLLIKYMAGIMVLMPAKVNINQLALGFLTADLLLSILSIIEGFTLVLPFQIIAVQCVVLLMYKGANVYQVVSTSTYNIPYLKRRLITEVA